MEEVGNNLGRSILQQVLKCILLLIILSQGGFSVAQNAAIKSVYNYDTLYVKPDTVSVQVLDTVVVYDTVSVAWTLALSSGLQNRKVSTPMELISNQTPYYQFGVSYLGNRWYSKLGIQYSTYSSSEFSYSFYRQIAGTSGLVDADYEQISGSRINHYQVFSLPFTGGYILDVGYFSFMAGAGFGYQYLKGDADNYFHFPKQSPLDESELLIPELDHINNHQYGALFELRFLYYISSYLSCGLDANYYHPLSDAYHDIDVVSGSNYKLNMGLVVSYLF